MARDDVYRNGHRDWRGHLIPPPSWSWDTPPAPTPLADVAAALRTAAEHGRPFGPTPPAEGDTPC